MTKTITFNKIIATQHGGILKALAGSVMTASLLISQGVMAADGNSCNAILTLGLYNTTQKTDSTKSNSVALSQLCAADYRNFQTKDQEASSQAMSIRASVGWFTGGVSSASSDAISKETIIQTQSQLCTHDFNSSNYLNDSTLYAKQVYQGSLDAWNKCNDLYASGLKFKTNPSIDLTSLSVELSAMSTGSSLALKGVSQSGGKANCTTTLPPRNGSSISGKVVTVDQSTYIPFNNASILSIRCNREMIEDPTLGKYTEATTFNFSTTAGDVVIPMEAIGKVPRVAYDQAVGDITSIAVKTSSQLSGMIAAFNLTSCPVGWSAANGVGGRPDLRGEFIRGFDDGRGVDSNRKINTFQDHQLQSHTHKPVQNGIDRVLQSMGVSSGNSGIFAPVIGPSASVDNWGNTTGPLGANVGTETRPRNIALLYCVKN